MRLPRRAAGSWAAVRACGLRVGAVSYDLDGEPLFFDHVFIPGHRFRITREQRYDEQPASGRGEISRSCEPQAVAGWDPAGRGER